MSESLNDDASERIRSPKPLLRHRLPTRRGATEQPNAGSDAPAPLTPQFWLLVIVTGVVTGLFAAGMMWLLHTAQHVAYDYRSGLFQHAVERVSWEHRLLVLGLAGLIAGIGWHTLRRLTPGDRSDVHGAVWGDESRLTFRRAFPSSILSEIVVGMGVSLGREQAPQLLGAVSGSILGRWGGLTPEQRRLLLACGSGAGLAAVYNVPIGGALVIAELLYGRITLSVVLPALVTCVIATMVAWIYIPNEPTYMHISTFPLNYQVVVWAVLAGPLFGVAAVVWTRLIGLASAYAPQGWPLLFTPLIAFLLLGAAATIYPQLLGNGKDLAYSAFLGHGALSLFLILFALKPLVTALCLGSGASGGLFTPTLSIGATLGAFLGSVWRLAFAATPVGAFAIIGSGAMLAASLQAPFAALVLTIELTQSTLGLTVPLVLAAGIATAVARYLDGYSIYSSRLPATRPMATPIQS